MGGSEINYKSWKCTKSARRVRWTTAVHIDNDQHPQRTITHTKETGKYKFSAILPGQSTYLTKTWSLKKWMKEAGSRDSQDIANWGNITTSNPLSNALLHALCAGITTASIVLHLVLHTVVIVSFPC